MDQQPQMQQPQPQNQQPQQNYHAKPKTSTMAILSLVFSFVFAPLGILFGIIALLGLKKSGESGKGLAIAGTIIGAIGTLISLLLIAGLLLAAGELNDAARDTNRKIEAGRVLSQLQTYASNNSGQYPSDSPAAWAQFQADYLADSLISSELEYFKDSSCTTDGNITSGVTRTNAVRVLLEDGSYYCQDSR